MFAGVTLEGVLQQAKTYAQQASTFAKQAYLNVSPLELKVLEVLGSAGGRSENLGVPCEPPSWCRPPTKSLGVRMGLS